MTAASIVTCCAALRYGQPSPLDMVPFSHDTAIFNTLPGVNPRLLTSQRTNIDAPVPCRQHKHTSLGHQEGRCDACGIEFPFRVLEVDHIMPRAVLNTYSIWIPASEW